MIKNMFKKAFETFRRKPGEICGFTVVYWLLKGAAASLIALPVTIIALLLSASGGMMMFYRYGGMVKYAGDSLAWTLLIVPIIMLIIFMIKPLPVLVSFILSQPSAKITEVSAVELNA